MANSSRKNYLLITDNGEGPAETRLRTLIDLRVEAVDKIEAYTEGKNKINAELMTTLESIDADGFVYRDYVVDRVAAKGALRWDAKYLESVLTPEQIERARVRGDDIKYIKVTEKRARAATIREEMQR